MAEPARHLPLPPDEDLDDETSEPAVLQRWVERPDGHLELVEMPLTPELFLDPQLEDKMVQGQLHGEVTHDLAGLLKTYLRSKRDDVVVLWDVKHYLVPGLPAPAPDVSVIYGIHQKDFEEKLDSFDVAKEGVRPSLVIEVVSPKSARIRRTDKVDKVKLYQTAGISEYLILDPPRRKNRYRYEWTGYRLDAWGFYSPIEPEADGALFSETTGLSFTVSPRRERYYVLDENGEPLLSHGETDKAWKAEKEAREKEAEARRAAEEKAAHAEAELARVREELARLRKSNLS
jgi:Uma2 family endonuclease